MKEALFYEMQYDGSIVCDLCPHVCCIGLSEAGVCCVRGNTNGTLYAESYGCISSLALDPIEKKPLNRFYPGSLILSVGSYGCNMKCAYCQNHTISQQVTSENPKLCVTLPRQNAHLPNVNSAFVSVASLDFGVCGGYLQKPETEFAPPEKLLRIAKNTADNIGIAFTYNEPLIGIEYILDTAPLFREAGLKVVLVTNGMINEEPLEALLPYVDAMNIDVKAFNATKYKELCGNLPAVIKTVEKSAAACHVEITSLIVPGQNDTIDDIQALAEWLSGISPEIPLHITRFFPRYRMSNGEPTPVKTMRALADSARKILKYVY